MNTSRPANATAYLVLTNISPEQWSYPLNGERQVIGRGQDVNIRVPAQYTFVSRRHAETWSDRGGMWLKDLNSRFGTHVNGVWIRAEHAASIAVGDRIWMGGLELSVVAHVSRLVSSRPNDPERDSAGVTQTILPDTGQLTLEQLTSAEREVVLWIGRGLVDDVAIARKLQRSPNTVRTQVGRIFQKLNVHSRGELVTFLRQVSTTTQNMAWSPSPAPQPDDTGRFRRLEPK